MKICQVQGFSGISVFFERLAQTIDKTGFLMVRFLHVYIIYSNLGGNIYDFEF